nr:unnamed protein product [Callosobruchus analis]
MNYTTVEKRHLENT